MGVAPTIEGFRRSSVKGELLPDEVRGLALGREALHTIMHKIPVVVSDPSADVDRTDDIATNLQLAAGNHVLTQPSELHKRSFVIDNPDFRQTWQDEFGNSYAAISVKGNNFSQPGLHEHPTAAEGVIPFGLQESSIIERVLKASQYLRSKSVSTEYIFGVSEPSEYPWPDQDGEGKDELLRRDEYKRRIVMDYWTKLPLEERTLDTLSALRQQFEDMTFLVTYRATDSPYRLFDLHDDDNRKAVYDYANEHLVSENEQPFEAGNDADYLRYMGTILAPKLGVNLARMHAGGVAHKFLHTGNITALGGIVDLDSAFGKPLNTDDEEISDNDIAYDVLYLLSELVTSHTKGISYDDNVDSANEFMKSYELEIYQLLDENQANKHILTLISSLETQVIDQEDGYALDGMRQLFLRAALRFSGSTPDGTPDQLLELVDRLEDMVAKYYTIISEYEDARDRVMAALLEPDVINDANNEFWSEITEAYQDDEPFDYLENMLDSTYHNHDEVFKKLIDATFGNNREKFEMFDVKDNYDNGDGELAAIILRMTDEFLKTEQDKRFNSFLSDMLHQRIFPEIWDDVNARMALRIPETVLASKDSTHLRYFGNRDSFLLSSERIDIEVATESVKDQEVDIRDIAQSLDKRGQLAHVSPTGYQVEQIVTNVQMDGSWGVDTNDDGQHVFETGFDETPSYILVIEANKDGDRKLTLLKDN